MSNQNEVENHRIRYAHDDGTTTYGPACGTWACAVMTISLFDTTKIDALMVNDVAIPLQEPMTAMNYRLLNWREAQRQISLLPAKSPAAEAVAVEEIAA